MTPESAGYDILPNYGEKHRTRVRSPPTVRTVNFVWVRELGRDAAVVASDSLVNLESDNFGVDPNRTTARSSYVRVHQLGL
jgi:hypothetical protein